MSSWYILEPGSDAPGFVAQVLCIEDIFKQRVTNIVFMGMGEPLMNLASVLDAHRTINKVCNSSTSALHHPCHRSCHNTASSDSGVAYRPANDDNLDRGSSKYHKAPC